MKKIKIVLGLAALFLLPVFFFGGCSEKSDVNAPNQINFDSPQFAVIDYKDINNAIEEGTIDTPIAVNNVLANYGFMNMGSAFVEGGLMMRGNPWLEHFDFGKHLGLFFRRLKLTDEQKVNLKDLMTAYHAAIKPLVKEFVDANKEIIADANAKRKEIADKVKSGELTRAEAAPLIKALNEATRDAIKNNPESITVKGKMCDARTTLFDGIAKILSPDQLEKWNTLISKIPTPC